MEKGIEKLRVLLGFHYFVHERIYRESHNGYIDRKKILITLMRNHNIPKAECPIIIKGLEMLELIKKEDKMYKIEDPKKSHEELVFEFKKKMKLV